MMKQVQTSVKSIIGCDCRVLSVKGDDVLVQLDDGQQLIVDLNDKKINVAKAVDAGIQFDGTGYKKDKQVETVVLQQSEYDDKQKRLYRIMSILNLTSLAGWQEIDRLGDLSLVHYNEDADMSQVGHLRGVCVDTKHGVVVASSFGYTPTVKSNLIDVTNDHVVLQDAEQQYAFPREEVVMKRAYEGVIMRVIHYRGEMLRLTHKRIRPLKSRWGNSPFFTNMYQEAGCRTDDNLFNVEKQYSPWC